MRKNRMRLTESQLQRVIKESVKNVLRESYYDEYNEWEEQNNMWVDYVSDHLSDTQFALTQAEKLYAKMRKNDGGNGIHAEHLDDSKNTAMHHLIGNLKDAIANMHRLAGHGGSAY